MGFLRTYFVHPRRLALRRAVFQVHLWVGVLLALYVVLIALTGSLLVFREELNRAGVPREFAAYDAGRTAGMAEVLRGFAAALPGGRWMR